MKTLICSLSLSVFVCLTSTVSATTYYVNANSTNPTPPFTDWTIAATNIQNAIDAAANGDLVLVSNGVYATGGETMDGILTNRVSLNKALTVQSVNGPWVTTIQGGPFGSTAARCAWLTNNASLIGFTLAGGATKPGGGGTPANGGGVWGVSSNNSTVVNCIIVSNLATQFGGGAYQVALKNCLISSNQAQSQAAAAYGSTLNNCTVVSNSGGPGLNLVIATNCIVQFNGVNGSVDNYINSTLSYCCTMPLSPGPGNITNFPQLFVDGVHLTAGSPCIGAGTNVATGTDIFGQPWANPPSMGCAEFQPSPVITFPQLSLTSDPVGFTLTANLTAPSPYTASWMQNGTPLQDNGHFIGTQTNFLKATGVLFSDAGNYQLVVSNAFGVITSAVATLVVHCVDAAGANPVAPYSTWATAATNIQDGITAATADEVVLVTNGLYASGGKSVDGILTNRVTIDKGIIVASVNGPGVTSIQGAWDPATNGPLAVRCAWLTNTATLSGFKLFGGATQTNYVSGTPVSGGGVWGSSSNVATVAGCVICTNSAYGAGGGAYQVKLLSCSLLGNTTAGSGGGANHCNLRQCFVTGNYATGSGGGAENCHSTNCAFTMNSALQFGTAADAGTLLNCTVDNNFASSMLSIGSSYGQAVNGARLTNCIVYGNVNSVFENSSNYSTTCLFMYSDTAPPASGTSNISVNPQLFGDGIHLTVGSPCIGAGNSNVTVGADIDGQPWNVPPSMGCDEWSPAPLLVGAPAFQVNSPGSPLTASIAATGQGPLAYSWLVNGIQVTDNGHYTNSSSFNLFVNNFAVSDAGGYQIIVSNMYGAVTSQVAQLNFHVVDGSGTNPVAPYSTWATAATNIQDAINSASVGDIVLVTNGVYASGGISADGVITNRVTINRPMSIISVNGYSATTIQGQWDPQTTNGPLAIRCALLTNGAMLSGFTLVNGATRSSGAKSAQSGGGVFCASTNALVYNCDLTNDSAVYGGGFAGGTLNNSVELFNIATYGGGAYYATLNNCNVENNGTFSPFNNRGAGIFDCIANNSIVGGNYDGGLPGYSVDNYGNDGAVPTMYWYCCTDPVPIFEHFPPYSGGSNINDTISPPIFLDAFHISATSPCRGAGSSAYVSGTDLDGEPWQNPPSIGCDEIINADLVGSLSVSIFAVQQSLVFPINHFVAFQGVTTGRESQVNWAFQGGGTLTNAYWFADNIWTNPGIYTVTFTAFNFSNTNGVSTNVTVTIDPLTPASLPPPVVVSNGVQFSFVTQTNGWYNIQYATNLVPPVNWQELSFFIGDGNSYQVSDNPPTNQSRFYRVLEQ